MAEKVIIALLGTVLGFISSYLLDRSKAKREPRPRLSWDASIERTLVKTDEEIGKKIEIVYDNTVVESLTYVRCTVANTGNRVIKDQELRFPFPEGVRLLEHYLHPAPEPELDETKVDEAPLDGKAQCRYRIGQLEQNEEVSFTFVTSGGHLADWRPHTRNKEGGVEFQRRDAGKAKEDQEHVPPFLRLTIIALALPLPLSTIPWAPLTGFTTLLLCLFPLLALMPHIAPVARVINRLITARLQAGSRSGGDLWAHAENSRIVQISDFRGTFSYNPPDEGPDAEASTCTAPGDQAFGAQKSEG